jgi:pyruvate/2-oxoglutarate dehydrogenase complex dihydrolipoamide dehydrogenase (E3) component
VSENCDAIVVGMGPGGEDLAGRLAQAGLNVVGVERRLVGGECPYWGCIPSKMMIRAGNLLAEARRIPGMAGTAAVSTDWTPVAQRIREATDAWDDRVVRVGDRLFEASRAIVLNPGTAPVIPPMPGLDQVDYWTNREVIELEALPLSLAVLGGGAVGLELAQVLARFGVRVSVIEMGPRLLAVEEPEAGAVLAAVFAREGIEVHVGAKPKAVRREGDDIVVELEDGQHVSGRRLLVATGRRAMLAELGLESVGVDPNQHWIPVDQNLRVADRLWAVGDATGHGAFTHISMYQAAIATADILGRPHPPADYRALPRVTFTDPEVGATGLTEAQARDRGLRVRTGVGNGQTSTRGWIHGPGNEGFIKLVEDAGRGVLVGGSAAGPMGGEVMSMLMMAVQTEVPVENLRHMIYAYPTFHRGIEDALAALA